MVMVQLSPSVVSSVAPIRLNFHLDTTLQLSAQEARRLVNQQIVPEMGTGLIAEEPELAVSNSEVIWRVPLVLSLPQLGDLGRVGTIDVNALTGVVIEDEQAQRRIIQHARRLYKGATLPTK